MRSVSVLLKNISFRRYKFVATFAIAVTAVFAFWVLYDEPVEESVQLEHVEEILAASSSLPVRLIIPALTIDVGFEEPLGLTESGEISVPAAYDTVGYYKYGPTPGEIGPAVILGHVDSYIGPAVFYSLGQLQAGDEIRVVRADGTVAIFVVTSLERHLQSEFPTEEVYGNINHAGLRLITCSGIYSKNAQKYSHNLIVYAVLDRLE